MQGGFFRETRHVFPSSLRHRKLSTKLPVLVCLSESGLQKSNQPFPHAQGHPRVYGSQHREEQSSVGRDASIELHGQLGGLVGQVPLQVRRQEACTFPELSGNGFSMGAPVISGTFFQDVVPGPLALHLVGLRH